jgi:hypothetical protein
MFKMTILGKIPQDVARTGPVWLNSTKCKFKCCRAILLILMITSLTFAADTYDLTFSTYFGGPANDNGRSGFLGGDGSLYVTGSSDGPGWPAQNAYQAAFAGGYGDYGAGDNILAKLTPARTITIDPSKTYQTINGW